jgi:hypothetical protein
MSSQGIAQPPVSRHNRRHDIDITLASHRPHLLTRPRLWRRLWRTFCPCGRLQLAEPTVTVTITGAAPAQLMVTVDGPVQVTIIEPDATPHAGIDA